MNSCFPPIAALNIGDTGTATVAEKSKKKNSNAKKNAAVAGKEKMDVDDGNSDAGKIDVLQDLGLFYIKQIAHNLKVPTDLAFILHSAGFGFGDIIR